LKESNRSVMGGVREFLVTKLEPGNEKFPSKLKHYERNYHAKALSRRVSQRNDW